MPYQALYAETLMSFQEFSEMFPRELYDLVSINNEVLIEASILKFIFFRLGESFQEHWKPSRRFMKKSVKLEENGDMITIISQNES